MDEQNVCFADSQTTDASDTNSVDSAKVECPPPTQTRLCLIGDLCKDPKISQAAQSFGVPVVISETGREFLNDGTCDTVFVVKNFSGPVFNAIHESEMRILGPTALQECAQKGEGLPANTRPLYSLAMSGLVICFTGFRKKDELNRLILLIHHMGGSIRKDMASRVTHLIANSCGGEKYRYAITFSVPIMSEAWVDALWEKRDYPGVSAVSEEMMEHKLKPFHGAHVCFYGFSDEERLHMTEVLQENGGTPVELEDPRCSHVVVDGGETYDLLKANVVVPRKIFPSVRKTSTPVPNLVQSMPDCSSKPPKIPRRSVTPRNSEMVRRSSRRLKSCSEIKVSTNNISTSSIGMLNQDFNNSDIFDTSKCLERSSSIPSTSTITSSSIGCLSANVSNSSELFNGKLWENNTSSSMLWLCDAPSIRGGRMATPEQAVPKHSSRSCPSVNRRASYDGYESGTVPDGVFKEPGPRRLSLGVGTRNRVTPCPGFVLTSRHPPLSCGNPPIVEEENALTAPVVDESEVQSIPEKAPLRAPIVKAEWFWASVQNEGCADEKEYLFEDYLEALLSPSKLHPSQHSTPASRARKRKRLRDAVSRLVQIDSPAIHKRRSSVSDAALLSMSGSFLDDDHTLSPEKATEGEGESSTETPRKSASPRRQVFLELVQTEANYVGILHTIMTLFKVPLEEMAETNSPLLNNTELKIIFGNLPPIYEVHCHMLEELKWMATHWKEDCSIGKIILKYAPDLMKAYPPFVNFFENTREMLVDCDQSKPRFHAFLKIGQTRSECGRQTLQELLIRPVQRLPSISLLLNDILKHTPKSNSDQTALEQALAAIREVMTHINEDKRKTEGQLVMFDIFNDIDNCPPHLVSSHRNFIVRCDVMELSDGLSGRGDSLVLFLFSDIMEVCKKRSKVFNSLKSPNTTTGSLHSVKMSNGKPFKHIRLMALSSIRRVFDIHETDECHNVFALRCRSNQELKEKLYLFTLADEETDKLGFLRTLCRQMANTMCKTDAENFLTSVDSQSLDIDTSDINSGTLSKAFKFASRTRIKVGRAFSFNKTPSKLKRAVSTMMSPFGSTTNLTPASQLAQMRLASCNNLSELGSSPLKGESSYIAPMSVQPTRKNKSASLNVMSLRRL